MSENEQLDSEARKPDPAGRYRAEPEPSKIAEPAAAYGLEPLAPLPLAVAQRVHARLGELEKAYRRQGRSLEDLGSPEELAERMLASVPAPSPWAELGNFYSTSGVAKLLGGVSRQAIADRRQRGTLLALRTADGAWVYPELQFDEHHAVIDGLPEIWRILRASHVDEWTLSSWLASPMSSLQGRSPIEWLRRGEDRETLLAVVRDAARRFSQ